MLFRHFIEHPRTGLELQISLFDIQQVDDRRQAKTCTGPLSALVEDAGPAAVIDFRFELDEGGLVHPVPDIGRVRACVENTIFAGNLYGWK